MKNVTNETNYKVLQEIGKLFDLKVIGVKAAILVDEINAKIGEMKAPVQSAGKWYENKEVPFAEGEIVDVVTGWATGRQVQIVKPSAKVDAYKARMYNPKSGDLQGTLVTVNAVDIVKYIPQLPALVSQVG